MGIPKSALNFLLRSQDGQTVEIADWGRWPKRAYGEYSVVDNGLCEPCVRSAFGPIYFHTYNVTPNGRTIIWMYYTKLQELESNG